MQHDREPRLLQRKRNLHGELKGAYRYGLNEKIFCAEQVYDTRVNFLPSPPVGPLLGVVSQGMIFCTRPKMPRMGIHYKEAVFLSKKVNCFPQRSISPALPKPLHPSFQQSAYEEIYPHFESEEKPQSSPGDIQVMMPPDIDDDIPLGWG